MSHYTVNGKKENKDDKDTIPGTSLKELMLNLPDFKSETTLLQYQAEQLGVRVICSPKYHPEIAGEAIEYCWGISKNTYRRYPLQDKRTRAKFVELVDECQECNTLESVRLFGRRMRRYMLAYIGLEIAKERQQADSSLQPSSTNNNNINLNLPQMSCALVERLVSVHKKRKRSHRNIADQEKKFLESVVQEMKRKAANIK